MKTAGTSFRNYLYELKPGLVYPTQKQLAENPRKGWYLKTDEFLSYLERQDAGGFSPNDYQFYFGHYPFALREKLNFNVRIAVMFREPASRALSMIRHRKRSNPEHFGNMTDIEMLQVEDFRDCQITNYQTKVIGLTDGLYNVNARYKCNDQTLEKAISNLNETDYIGLSEDVDSSIRLFQRIIGISAIDKFPWLNKNNGQASISLEFREAVMPFIEYDIILYEQAKQLFYKNVKDL